MDFLIYTLFSCIVRVLIWIISLLKSGFLNSRNKNDCVQRGEDSGKMGIRRQLQFLDRAEHNLKRSHWLDLAFRQCSECPHHQETSWKVVLGSWECQDAWCIFWRNMNNVKEDIPDVKNGFRMWHHRSNTLEFLLNCFCTHCEGKKLYARC